MAPIKDDVIRCQLPARAHHAVPQLGRPRRVREFFKTKNTLNSTVQQFLILRNEIGTM